MLRRPFGWLTGLAILVGGSGELLAQKPPARKVSGNRPIPRATEPKGVWRGQDGSDRVGPSGRAGSSDVQDIRIALDGLPAKEIAGLTVKGFGGDEWRSSGQGAWLVLVDRQGEAASADLFLEPTRAETGRGFEIVLDYKDGTKQGFWIQGGKADPNLRVPGASMGAKWLEGRSVDRTGPGPSVGPDGLQDALIALETLSPRIGVRSVRIEASGGLAWESGKNPKGHPGAEFVRDAADPSRAEVFFQPTKDLKGPLAITLTYEGDRTDTAKVSPGKIDAKAMPTPALPTLLAHKMTSKWLGQDGQNLAGPGDVHVAIEGLAVPRPVAAVALSNASRAAWSWRGGGQVAYRPDPFAMPLEVRRSPDGKVLHLFFPPDRDETGSDLMARLVFDDGKIAVVTIPGGKADVALRSPGPRSGEVRARPGDDLHRLAQDAGTLRLAAGTYELDRPLVLDKPIAIEGEPGAVLKFSQKGDDAPWTAAIKVHCGRTTLKGFALKFGGPVRWKADVEFGPAVIGTTDNTDSDRHDPKAGIVLEGLDLEGPPPADPNGREEAVALVRMTRACSGKVTGCTLRGGMVRFTKGPWEIRGNTYRGPRPGSFAWAVFSCHNSHDLTLAENVVKPEPDSGKTWRFLVQTVSGIRDRIEGNRVEGVGPRNGDTHTENAPEAILTEAYRLHFEGKPAAISADGRLLAIAEPQGGAARTGDVVAVLAGPHAGTWSRVAQAIDDRTYLVDPPLSQGDEALSIVTGFVDEVYRGNTLDARGGAVACHLVLVGNHFGLKVLGNTLKGAGPLKIMAVPSEEPVHWGWSQCPAFGVEIAGNTIEDPEQPGVIGVEREGPAKSSSGRVYFRGILKDNVIAWTSGSPRGIRGINDRVALRIGDEPPLDAGEAVVVESGNRSRGGAARLEVRGATINGKEVRGRTVPLSGETSAGAAARERR